MAMALHELIELSSVVASRVPEHATRIRVDSVDSDSRAVTNNALFCCIRGRNTDGHSHAEAAVLAGASVLLVDHVLPVDVPQLVVADTAAAAGALASAFAGHPSRSLRIVGVTGTNGKTTVTHLLESISIAVGHKVGVVGTIETRFAGQSLPAMHTTPDQCTTQRLLAAMFDAGVNDVAIEVSSHALDQSRVAGTRFAVACFTNLSRDHLDYHKSMAAYGAAKARLFVAEYAPIAVINVADEFGVVLAALAARNGLDVWTFGTPSSDVYVRSVSYNAAMTVAQLTSARTNDEFTFEIPLVGAFNVENALCAITAHLALGTSPAAIIQGLAEMPQIPGRLERVSTELDRCHVFVDYAHTPDALTEVLGALRGIVPKGASLRAVFGCGGDRDRAKRPDMAQAVAAGADTCIITSDNPRSEEPAAIVADALADWPAALTRPDIVLDRKQAIEAALQRARLGDVVVIAGKGHETTQTVGEHVSPFDDRTVARELLAGMR